MSTLFKTIATHNGVFHADEVSACAILKLVYTHIHVTRTRDMNVLAEKDFVVDVGGIYDPSTNKFDHHQKDPSLVRENGHPYSSAGLLWKHYGLKVLANTDIPEEYLHAAYKDLDKKIFEGIDALDNGISCYKANPDDIELVNISQFIKAFNAADIYSEVQYSRFEQILGIVYEYLQLVIQNTVSYYKSLKELDNCIIASSGKDILSLTKPLPWKQVLEERNLDFKLVIFPSSKFGEYMIQAVNVPGKPFESKIPLPEKLIGLSSGTLGDVDIVFTHKGGFLASVKTSVEEKAYKAAEAWLEEARKEA
jgi:uncharacterized UPF0160 family protein